MSGTFTRRATQTRKLARILRHPLMWRGLRHGVAATVEHEPVLRRQSWRTIFDIGANIGQFTLAARAFSPEAEIIAFEPLAGAAARFHALMRHDSSVVLHRVAIGPSVAALPMHVSRRADSSSLLPIGPKQSALFPGTGEDHIESVSVAPLDALVRVDQIRAPALLKIDVQGYELEALRGCNSLLPMIAAVYVECSFMELYQGQALFNDVNEFLLGSGFSYIDTFNHIHDEEGSLVQADAFFMREQDS